MKIALGSTRAAKEMALRACIARIATIETGWEAAEVITRSLKISAPAMPLTDEELMRGAHERAWAARALLLEEAIEADLYVGLEGGLHTVEFSGERHTFLRGWAYVTDGLRGSFGAAPSISVPTLVVRRVVEGRRELGDVIDEVAGEQDVRSRQGAWGVLSRDLLTRAMSFEAALIAAFAPFYNAQLFVSCYLP